MFKKFLDSKPLRWVRYIRQQLQNQRQNRELVGQDRDGNKYYQYYSYWGLPTRREIRWKNEGDFVMKDLVYYRWLHHQEFDVPSQSEKQMFYLQQEARHQRALEWDQKQENILLQFRKKRQQLALRDQALALLEKELQANSELTDIKTKRTSTSKTQTKNINQPDTKSNPNQSA